jgi:hypothetical protein
MSWVCPGDPQELNNEIITHCLTIYILKVTINFRNYREKMEEALINNTAVSQY